MSRGELAPAPIVLLNERIRNHLDRPLQGQQPMFAVAAMRSLPAMSEDVPLDVLFYDGRAIGAEGVPQI